MVLEGRLITGYYVSRLKQKPLLHLVIRTDVDKRVAVELDSPIYPYFFAEKDSLNSVLDVAEQLEEPVSYLKEEVVGKHLYNKNEYAEVGVYDPKKVGKIRKSNDELKLPSLCEADISYVRRVMIDGKFKRKVKISKGEIYSLPEDVKVPDERYLFFDVEYSRSESRITMVSGGNEADKIVTFGDDVKGFLQYAGNFDVWVGWYAEYDEGTVIKEAKKLNIRFPFRDHVFVDIMEIHDLRSHRQQKLESMRLDYVANYELGEGKVNLEGNRIDKLHKTNPVLLEKYNRKDVELIIRLNHVMQREPAELLETHSEIADLVGLESMDKTLYPSAVVDTFMMREYVHLKPRIILPCRKSESVEDKYKGAKVYIPTVGIYENVDNYDFKGLYNSIIRSLNISPELYEDWMKEEKDISKIIRCLASKPLGVFPSKLKEVTEQRDLAKKEGRQTAQNALKLIGNEAYGSIGQGKNRFYNKVMVDLITRTGRFLILSSESKLREHGIKVDAGDTDSLFVGGRKYEI